MNTPAVQHSVNAAVVAVPFGLWASHAQEVVTISVGVMAFLYYLLYFTKEFITWKKSWHKVETVTTTHTVVTDTAVKPGPLPPPAP